MTGQEWSVHEPLVSAAAVILGHLIALVAAPLLLGIAGLLLMSQHLRCSHDTPSRLSWIGIPPPLSLYDCALQAVV